VKSNLFFHEIRDNPDLQVRLTGGFLGDGGFNPPALLMGDFAMGADAKWNSPIQELIKKHLGGGFGGLFGGITGAILNAGVAISPLSWPAIASRKNWMLSNGPAIKLPLLFVAIDGTEDVTAPVKQLAHGVFPTESSTARVDFTVDKKKDSYALLTAPNNYDMTGTGTVSVSIGGWFKAMNCYVMDSMTVNFPQQYLPSGKPLYAEVSLSLSPYQTLTHAQFSSFFT
jgi:hypothetical protein